MKRTVEGMVTTIHAKRDSTLFTKVLWRDHCETARSGNNPWVCYCFAARQVIVCIKKLVTSMFYCKVSSIFGAQDTTKRLASYFDLSKTMLVDDTADK
jgi:hypothetical protein